MHDLKASRRRRVRVTLHAKPPAFAVGGTLGEWASLPSRLTLTAVIFLYNRSSLAVTTQRFETEVARVYEGGCYDFSDGQPDPVNENLTDACAQGTRPPPALD